MSYTSYDFGKDLERELAHGYDVVRIARAAFSAYQQNSRDVTPDLYKKMFQIIAMEEGPEFELSEPQFREFIAQLQKSARST